MSFLIQAGARVFVYSEAIDMRSGFSKLQALVTEGMKANLYAGHLFLFLGKNRRRAKLLRFDGSGVLLIVKRLDRGSFMRIDELHDTPEITLRELERLLDGVNLRVVFASAQRARGHQEFR